MTTDPESYFPSDYRAARRNFIAAAEARGIDVIARVHPTARGPDGKPLFLDTAAIGPRDASRGLLLTSGTHGVEGYFGSGAQTGLLREGLAPPPGARIVLVHALNPYGFGWDQRVNEDNIDINRNFVDHANPPVNAEYDGLAEALSPRDLEPATWAAAKKVMDDYRDRHGMPGLQSAATRGQYRYPQGIWYGGARECWSHAMLHAVLGEDLAKAEKLVAVDFHTGLGQPGAGEMITEALPGSAEYARATAMWGDAVKSTEAGQSLSPPLTGTLDRALAAWLPDVELTFAALEVGTKPVPQVLDALRRSNWVHNFAADKTGPQAAAIARECRDAFYVDTPEWKAKVFALAQAAVSGALAAL
jgi:Protein of unknown function (DUF2817)